MVKAKVNTDVIRLMLAGLVVGFVVALPVGAHALVSDDKEPITQQDDQEPEQTPVQSPEPTSLPTPDPIASPEPSPTPSPEVNEPNESPVTETAPVTELQVAITIASAEHPNIEVLSAKVKRLGAEKVYKVTFADGWRIYVSADDGEVYVVKDQANKRHALHNYAKKHWMKKYGYWKPWSSKYKSHSKAWMDSRGWNADNNTRSASTSFKSAEASSVSSQRSGSDNHKKNSHASSHRHYRNQ